MYHAKLKMKTYLLTTVLDSKGILSECKAKMRELLLWVKHNTVAKHRKAGQSIELFFELPLVFHCASNWSSATLRHHLLAESDVEFWRRCRSVTSLVQSGNMIEVAFGYQICIVGTILNSVCHVQVDGP